MKALRGWTALAPLLLLLTGACSGGGAARQAIPVGPWTLTVSSGGARHAFTVEIASTPEQQEKGLMFRTGIPVNGGMLFWPYPPDVSGKPQPPRNASFWMKNTPSPLDIIFVRADGSIARIAENAVPFDESPLSSGEPVAAVLELRGGRTAELGIAAGDKVTLPAR